MLKDLFLLDPTIIFLNHGSFGACPAPVFEKYQAWQRLLERQPVQFLGVDLDNYLYQSRQVLGKYINASPADIVFITNATHGVNIIARSLHLGPGDEILTSDQEYGACNYTWKFICQKTGAVYKQQPVELPVASQEEIVDRLWQAVTVKTKVIFISHITSPTSLSIPVNPICQRARDAGILTIIDGAHAPGQMDVDMALIQPDFYVGNCHKWMMGPKGAGFLFARPTVQHIVEPLVVSWGYPSTFSAPRESIFIDTLQWTGTRDPAAALTVPSAISFMSEYHWDVVRSDCHNLLRWSIERICEVTGLDPLYPPDSIFFRQMATVPIPEMRDINELKARLYKDYRIEIPCIEWDGRHFLRISIQGYNSADDINILVEALTKLIPELKL